MILNEKAKDWVKAFFSACIFVFCWSMVGYFISIAIGDGS